MLEAVSLLVGGYLVVLRVMQDRTWSRKRYLYEFHDGEGCASNHAITSLLHTSNASRAMHGGFQWLPMTSPPRAYTLESIETEHPSHHLIRGLPR